MRINKSSRHQKIIGEFAEHVVLNWLSRSGWEATRVDHTGIDIVAFNPDTGQRIGITVKSRTRPAGREDVSVTLLSGDAEHGYKKIYDACQFFNCEPWLAVYVESLVKADLWLLPMKVYEERYRHVASRTKGAYWQVRGKYQGMYATDPDVMHIMIEFKVNRWLGDRGRREE